MIDNTRRLGVTVTDLDPVYKSYASRTSPEALAYYRCRTSPEIYQSLNTVKIITEAGSSIEAGMTLRRRHSQCDKIKSINVFHSVRSTVTAIAHTVYRKSLLPCGMAS